MLIRDSARLQDARWADGNPGCLPEPALDDPGTKLTHGSIDGGIGRINYSGILFFFFFFKLSARLAHGKPQNIEERNQRFKDTERHPVLVGPGRLRVLLR